MRTIRTKVYQFNELAEDAKQYAINNFRNNNETELYFFAENCQDRLYEEGFKNAELRYSLSYSQGDGLSFDAEIDLKQLLKEFKPDMKTSVFNMLASNLYATCKMNNGHYAYASKTDVEITLDSCIDRPNVDALVTEFETFVQAKYLRLCKELEQTGYADLEYQESDEYIIETIEANDYEFTKDGKLF